MEFALGIGGLGGQRIGCSVVGVYEGAKPAGPALAHEDFEGELGTTLFLHDSPHAPSERVLLVGLGRKREFAESRYRKALCSAFTALRTTAVAHAAVCLEDFRVAGRDDAWKIEHAVLAIMEAMYRFEKTASKSRE